MVSVRIFLKLGWIGLAWCIQAGEWGFEGWGSCSEAVEMNIRSSSTKDGLCRPLCGQV